MKDKELKKEFKYDPNALDTTTKHYFPGTEGARTRGVEVVITPELANDPKAAKMIKLMEATGATIHVGCSETMDINGNIAQAVTQKQLSDIRMLMHNSVAGAFRSSDPLEPIRLRGESELSRRATAMVPGMYRHSPKVKTGAIDFDALLDPQGILSKPVPAFGDSTSQRLNDGPEYEEYISGKLRKGLRQAYQLDETLLVDSSMGSIFQAPKLSPVGRGALHPPLFFPHYTEEYEQEMAIKRKAKRLKNQRRRRNAKARRK